MVFDCENTFLYKDKEIGITIEEKNKKIGELFLNHWDLHKLTNGSNIK